MFRLLIPVDGSSGSDRAVQHALRLSGECRTVELRLLNVQEPITAWEVRRTLRQEEIEAMQMSRGGDALHNARARLDAAGMRYLAEVRVGPIAQTIADYARQQACDEIVMGTRGLGAVQGILLGSVAIKVVHLSDVPVTLVK